MRATFTSNLPAFIEDHHKAVDAGLKEAATTYQQAVEARLSSGYKSGTFKTGKVAGSVEITEPDTVRGTRVIRVGTKVFYARFWEFGHVNRYSRHFERVPVWATVATEQAQVLAQQLLTSYGAMMSFWKPKGSGGSKRVRRKR